MLSGVLLHVIGATCSVDTAMDGAPIDGSVQNMNDGSCTFIFNAID